MWEMAKAAHSHMGLPRLSYEVNANHGRGQHQWQITSG